MPDAYKSVTDQMTERFADPTLKNLIRAGAIGHEVDAAKSDPQAQVRILTDRLKGAAPETTQAILADPRVSGLLDKVVANTYQKDGAVAASKMLRDLTDVASPELAKRLITSAQPTIDQMAKDLVWADRTDLDKFKANVPPNHEALFDSGGMDPYKTITDNLSVALSRTLPPGATTDQIRAAMKEDYFMNVGRTFASTMNGPQRDKFGYANVQSIEQGHAPYLLLSTISALREGKHDFAADELGSSLHQGLKNLGEAVDNANEDFKEARAQAVFQSANFGAFEAGATNKKTGSTDKYWTNYESGNKDLIKTQEDVDRLSAGLVDTTTAVGASDQVLKGLRSEERITKENNKLASSEKGLELVSLSERGKDHLYRLMDAGDAHAPVVAQLQPENLKREARTFVFRVGVSYTIRQMEAARIGNETGNFKQAQTAIENMKKHAGLLGYSKERQANFMRMLDGIGEMQAAGSDQVKLANGLTKFQSAVGDIHNGSTLNSTTGIGFGMRALGVMFVAPILQKQLATFLDKDTPLGVRAQTVLNTASTLHLSAFTAAGVPYAMGYKNAATTFIGTIKNWSEPIVVASAVVELALTYDYLKSGEHQDLTMAGLHGISAVSNGMMAWSYMKAGGHWLGARALSPVMLSGWGTALAVASSVGIYMYGRAKEMSKFENGETQKYLESLGFKPDIAKQLMNQDNDGHSVGPVLQAYAKANGWDLNKPEQVDEYITWINNLGKEKVESLVTAAQHVQPGEDGGLPLTNDKAKYLALPRDPAKTVQQLKDHGIDTKIFYNQAKQRWEDPTTQMFYTNDGWNYYGKIDDKNPDQILRYDLETTELMYADNRFQYANPDSIAGLEAWTISNGLALPEK
jgi:hypothetical protein